MRHLDLFSGIGGFALAADWTFGSVEHIFCEIDPFCQAVLEKHWPDARIYGDIRTLTNTRSEEQRGIPSVGEQEVSAFGGCYLLTGGFPCQPFSQAGRRKGADDDRYLWPEMLRVIKEFKPTWIIGENVAGILSMAQQQSETGMEGEADSGQDSYDNDSADGIIRGILDDIEQAGYCVQAFVIPAVAVNAPHRRDRVWIVAHANSNGTGEFRTGRDIHYINGNAPAKKQERYNEQSGTLPSSQDAPDTENKRGERSRRTRDGRKRFADDTWNQNWLEVAARLCRMDDGLSRRLDRNPRLKSLGNAIVPQVAAQIMQAIKLTDSPNTK